MRNAAKTTILIERLTINKTPLPSVVSERLLNTGLGTVAHLYFRATPSSRLNENPAARLFGCARRISGRAAGVHSGAPGGQNTHDAQRPRKTRKWPLLAVVPRPTRQ
jgi:hypothetical protein